MSASVSPRWSKLCGRLTCGNLIMASGPKTLAKREFCSVRCAVRTRIEQGRWHYPVPTDAERRRGGRLGGVRAAEMRRARAMQRHAEDLADLLPDHIRRSLEPRQLALIRVLLVHAWRRGYKTGYSNGFHAQRTQALRGAS